MSLALGTIVLVDITVLALSLRVALAVGMRTLVCERVPPKPVVAVVAHTFGEVLEVRVLAISDSRQLYLVGVVHCIQVQALVALSTYNLLSGSLIIIPLHQFLEFGFRVPVTALTVFE